MDRLTSRRLILRPVAEGDFANLHRWRNSATYLKMFTSKRTIVSEAHFREEQRRCFSRGRHLQFIIERKTDRASLGTIFSHTHSAADGYAFINTFIDDPFVGRGYGAEASIILSMHLFESFSLHKIYFEAFAYNRPSLAVMQGAGLAEEGVFREHRYFDGQRHDVFRFALYRDNCAKIRSLYHRLRAVRAAATERP